MGGDDLRPIIHALIQRANKWPGLGSEIECTNDIADRVECRRPMSFIDDEHVNEFYGRFEDPGVWLSDGAEQMALRLLQSIVSFLGRGHWAWRRWAQRFMWGGHATVVTASLCCCSHIRPGVGRLDRYWPLWPAGSSLVYGLGARSRTLATAGTKRRKAHSP